MGKGLATSIIAGIVGLVILTIIVLTVVVNVDDASDGLTTLTIAAPPVINESGSANESGYTLDLTFAAGGSGDFTVGETVSGATSGSDAEVVSWDSGTRKLVINNLTGSFKDGEVVSGGTSSASWTVDTLDSYNMGSLDGAMNKYFEVQGDVILDFSESNPFGDIGNLGDKF